MTPPQLIAAGCLTLLLVAEAAAPAFVEHRRDAGRLLRHDLRNLLLGLLGAGVTAFFAAVLLVAVDRWAAERGFGLLRLLALPAWLHAAVALLMFDLWMYWWHRLNHAVPLLWRLHRVHHSDPAMDASTGVRFHPGEIAASGVARLAVVPLLGVTAGQLAAYGAVSLPVVLLQHANVRLPSRADFGLSRWGLLVTPAMHRVHHSRLRDDTNSNYSSVLPIWDRLFGTLRVRRDVGRIEFGVDGFSGARSQTMAGLLAAPARGGENQPAAEAERKTADA